MGFTGSRRLMLIMMVASLWGMSMANKDWGSGFNHTGWGWGPYHPPNQTQGPNKINVGGSENWRFNFSYTEWAFQNGPFYFNDTLGELSKHDSLFFLFDLQNSTMISERGTWLKLYAN